MRKPGEITVFLSLVLVCILSLLMGLLESARTTGSRLYLQMAADSSMASVMSHYNRNLWESYHLLFLEYESKEALSETFSEFFSYYENQKNLYPIKLLEANLESAEKMTEKGGRALEEEILEYIPYRIPEAAADLAGLAEDAAKASKAGDFGTLLKVCRQAGKTTRRLEKKRAAVENCLETIDGLWKKTSAAAEEENGRLFQKGGKKLREEIERFSEAVEEYEKEIAEVSSYKTEAENQDRVQIQDQTAAASMNQELMAYGQIEEAALQTLEEYRIKETILKESLEYLNEALALSEELEENEEEAEEGEGEQGEETGWEEIQGYLAEIEIPESEPGSAIDREKSEALDRVEELLDQGILELVLPRDASLSKQTVSLKGIPSGRKEDVGVEGDSSPLEQLLINEYNLLFFGSFLEEGEGGASAEEKELLYELEYLLGGKGSDRENLEKTAEQILVIRGAANLLYLLSSPELKSQADGLAAAVAAGNAPVQFVVSFFILALWAFGEAILDLRVLLAGGGVPLWKSEETWSLSLDGLLL